MSTQSSRPRGIVSIADALIALDGLSGAELERAWQWLPDLIGIERTGPSSEREMDEDEAISRPSRDRLQQIQERRRLRKTEQPERKEEPGTLDPERPADSRRDAPTLPFRLDSQPLAEDPKWLARENDDLGKAKPFRFSDLPPLQPLLDPRRTRSVISSALATSQPDGDLDLETILERVMRRQPLLTLPRRNVPTTRLGLQLLLDRGEAMIPYLRDQEMLAEEIRNVFGQDRVEELRFADSPLDGVGTGPAGNWIRAHRSPARRTPVVLLTDLGIGRRRQPAAGASPEEWLRFARRQRTAGCPLLAVVPYDLGRVPPSLRSYFRLLPWSRTTTVATVRQLIGRGLESVR